LAYQRSEIAVEIRKSLLAAAIENWEFKKWQRVVKYRWSLKPLFTVGSLTSPGGRFNIGEIESTFPAFPALYVAEDKATALQEVLGQDPETKGKLNPYDLALTNPASVTAVSLSGQLQTVIDLTQSDRLQPFLELIRGFRLTPETRQMARELSKEAGLSLSSKLVVSTMKELLWVLLLPNWRELPVQLGIPSSTQIFGQLVSDAGVEGIIYPSKINDRLCAAVFPQAFAGTSFVALDDPPPRKDVLVRIDRESWKKGIR
jgi:hypothetical protein